MALQVRRVVTGHDKNGRAVVKFDDMTRESPYSALTTSREFLISFSLAKPLRL